MMAKWVRIGGANTAKEALKLIQGFEGEGKKVIARPYITGYIRIYEVMKDE